MNKQPFEDDGQKISETDLTFQKFLAEEIEETISESLSQIWSEYKQDVSPIDEYDVKNSDEDSEKKSLGSSSSLDVDKILEQLKNDTDISNDDLKITLNCKSEEILEKNFLKEIFSQEKSFVELIEHEEYKTENTDTPNKDNKTFEYQFIPDILLDERVISRPCSNSDIHINLKNNGDVNHGRNFIKFHAMSKNFSSDTETTVEDSRSQSKSKMKNRRKRSGNSNYIPETESSTISLLSEKSLLLREKFKYKTDYPFQHSSIRKELEAQVEKTQIVPIYSARKKSSTVKSGITETVTDTLFNLKNISDKIDTSTNLSEHPNLAENRKCHNLDINNQNRSKKTDKNQYLEEITKNIVDSESYFQKCLTELNKCAARVGLAKNIFNLQTENVKEKKLGTPVSQSNANSSVTTSEIVDKMDNEKIKELEKTIKEIDENKTFSSTEKQNTKHNQEELMTLIEKLKFLASYNKRVTLKSKKKRQLSKEKVETLEKSRKRENLLRNNNFEDVTTQMEFDTVGKSIKRNPEIKTSVQKVEEWKRSMLNTECLKDKDNQSRKPASQLFQCCYSSSNLSNSSKKSDKNKSGIFRKLDKDKQKNIHKKLKNQKTQSNIKVTTIKNKNDQRTTQEKIRKSKENKTDSDNTNYRQILEKVIKLTEKNNNTPGTNIINQSTLDLLKQECAKTEKSSPNIFSCPATSTPTPHRQPDDETRLLNQITPASIAPFAAEYSREKRTKTAKIKDAQKKKIETDQKRKDITKQDKTNISPKKKKETGNVPKKTLNNAKMSDVHTLQNLITDPNARFNTNMTIMPVTVQNYYKPPFHKKVVAEKPLEYQPKKKTDTVNDTTKRIKSPIRAYIMGHHKNVQLNDNNLMKAPPAYKDMLQATIEEKYPARNDHQFKQKKTKTRQNFFEKDNECLTNNYVNYENQNFYQENFLLPEKPLEKPKSNKHVNQVIKNILSLTDPLPVNNVSLCSSNTCPNVFTNDSPKYQWRPLEQLDGQNRPNPQENTDFKSRTTLNMATTHFESFMNDTNALKPTQSTENLHKVAKNKNQIDQKKTSPKLDPARKIQNITHETSEKNNKNQNENTKIIHFDLKNDITKEKKSSKKLKNLVKNKLRTKKDFEHVTVTNAQTQQVPQPLHSNGDFQKRLDRINNLAKPKRSYVEAQYREYKNRLGPEFTYRMNSIISKIQNPNFRECEPPKEDLFFDVLNGLDDIINIKTKNMTPAENYQVPNGLTITRIDEEDESSENLPNKNSSVPQLEKHIEKFESSPTENDKNETQKEIPNDSMSFDDFENNSNSGFEIAEYIMQLVVTEVLQDIHQNYSISAKSSSTLFRKLDEILSQDSTASDISLLFDSTISSFEISSSNDSIDYTTSIEDPIIDEHKKVTLGVKRACYLCQTVYNSTTEYIVPTYHLVEISEPKSKQLEETVTNDVINSPEFTNQPFVESLPEPEITEIFPIAKNPKKFAHVSTEMALTPDRQHAFPIRYRYVVENPIQAFQSSIYYVITCWERVTIQENLDLPEVCEDVFEGCGDGPSKTISWSDSLADNLLELRKSKSSSLDVCLSNSTTASSGLVTVNLRSNVESSSSSDSFVSLANETELANYYYKQKKIQNFQIVCKSKRKRIHAIPIEKRIIEGNQIETVYKDVSLFFLYGFLFLSAYGCFAIQPVCK